ncbi:MAG TPA: hypothetical protein VGL02_06695 [Streptomyces sp.]
MDEVWTTEQVAAYLDIPTSSVRKYMTRWGVTAHDRAPGKGGANRYLADQVRAAKAAAPGKGNRTPRKAPTPAQ